MVVEAGISYRPFGIDAYKSMELVKYILPHSEKTFLKLQDAYGMNPLNELVLESRGSRHPRKNGQNT